MLPPGSLVCVGLTILMQAQAQLEALTSAILYSARSVASGTYQRQRELFSAKSIWITKLWGFVSFEPCSFNDPAVGAYCRVAYLGGKHKLR